MVPALRWSRNMVIRSRLSSACIKAGRGVVRVIAWIPVVFVTAVLLWGYYVYVYIIILSGTCIVSIWTASDLYSQGHFLKGLL